MGGKETRQRLVLSYDSEEEEFYESLDRLLSRSCSSTSASASADDSAPRHRRQHPPASNKHPLCTICNLDDGCEFLLRSNGYEVSEVTTGHHLTIEELKISVGHMFDETPSPFRSPEIM